MSNENLSMSQDGLTHLKNDEGAIDGLYDDASDYGTFGVGHLVHPKGKWASFLLAAASADPGWKRLIVNGNGTSLLPRATATSSDFAKMKSAAVDIAKDTIARAQYKTDYAKLAPTQAAEVDALAVSVVETEATMLVQSIDVVLRNDLATFEKTVREKVTVQLAQDEFDALVSLTFNIGAANFGGSALLKKVNSEKHLSGTRKEREAAIAEIRKQFGSWRMSKGKVLAGLVTRRAGEADRFLARARAALATLPVKP